MKGVIVAVLLCWAASLSGQSGPVIQVEYSNPALIPGHWTLQLRPDGTGHFRSERGSAPRTPGEMIEAANVDRDIRVSQSFADRAFKVACRKRLFRMDCESHLNVAFQGAKKFSYSGPEGTGSCQFNYSRDQDIQDLGDSMLSLATTLIEGARLQAFLQHDRLGLDRETEILSESVADGRAVQMGSIRDILERLAEDDAVMERVRKRARALLSKAEN